MAGETSSIAKMAEHVSKEIFDWFKWRRIKLPDQNFDCKKVATHAPRKEKHTHPVDAVFWYPDPYLNKNVFFNTDLKSYAKGSIDANSIFPALQSLAKTIDCARVSDEWQERYVLDDIAHEIRGMLFVYNHDAEYDKDFYDLLASPVKRRGKTTETSIKVETLPIAYGQSVHVVEPQLINYLTTVIADANRMHAAGTFPEKQYEFFYPDLKLHRTHGRKSERPATVEMIAGPFLVIRHGEIQKYNEDSRSVEIRFPEGYVIYYNRPGSSAEEFMYFLDILSGYQILDGEHKIRVRLAHHSPADDIQSNFKRAIQQYVREWGSDKYKLERLNKIEVEMIDIAKYSFSRVIIGWERE